MGGFGTELKTAQYGVWLALPDGFMHLLFKAIPGRPPMYIFSGLTDLSPLLFQHCLYLCRIDEMYKDNN